jgi:hypothetical protein
VSAVLSPCGAYRYRLERDVAMEGPIYAFFGVNPSTADASEDDATVRKWIGFAKRWGASRFIVGNVFAFRATDVGRLAYAPDPWGCDNYFHVDQIMAEADILVPCWGSRIKLPKKLHGPLNRFASRFDGYGKPVMTFGRTASGDPKHPLMLGYETVLQPWSANA